MQPDGTYRLGATTNYLNLLFLSFATDLASLPTGERGDKARSRRHNGCWSAGSCGAVKVSPGVFGSSVLSGALMSSPLAFHQVEP
jgi:hypothetical protein